MAKRKIDLMHDMFGYGDGRCGDCPHFEKFHYRDHDYQKCNVYGITNSEATDWRQKWEGCGLFGKSYGGDIPIVETVKHGTKVGNESQIEGQMNLFVGEWC